MEDNRGANLVVLILSGTFAVLVGLDLITDYWSGGSGAHLILEGLLLALSGTFFVLGIKKLTLAKQKIKTLQVVVVGLANSKKPHSTIRSDSLSLNFAARVKNS